MPAIREALNSQKLTPCWTLIIFSFMVAFTLSILDLAVDIAALHLPVLITWIITVASVLLTAIYWLCQSTSTKRFRDGTCVGFSRERNLERSSLSEQGERENQRERATYGLGQENMESANLTNEWKKISNFFLHRGTEPIHPVRLGTDHWAVCGTYCRMGLGLN